MPHILINYDPRGLRKARPWYVGGDSERNPRLYPTLESCIRGLRDWSPHHTIPGPWYVDPHYALGDKSWGVWIDTYPDPKVGTEMQAPTFDEALRLAELYAHWLPTKPLG